jgi:Methyltransferase domain
MGAALLQLPSLNFEPLYYRPHGAGHWSGHVPFAYDLVAALRPSKIVELGTEYGESYFTFCQAVVECGIACQSFAVDTWRGDPHTGAYGESVFGEVFKHNQKHYQSFSTLLRTSFDNALQYFPDESIDLLHIDGLHTYEAVLHDFQAWFPKVSPGGIILIHDTQVRQSDFGVWRLWEELRGRYEGFEFLHSCGLGVLQKPGNGARCGVMSLLFQDGEQAGLMRRFYLVAGERLQYKDLSERQRRKGKWELLAKLFWRTAGQVFSEERSRAHRNPARIAVPHTV